MSSYKTEVTLNEKDSLQDMLIAEKTLMKVYATALSEGASKGFREGLARFYDQTCADQLTVFLTMTEQGYYEVRSESEDEKANVKEKFAKALGELA